MNHTYQKTNPLDLAAIQDRWAQREASGIGVALKNWQRPMHFGNSCSVSFQSRALSSPIPSVAVDFYSSWGASLVSAGLNACTRQPAEKIVPYIRAPEGLVLGKPLFFATAMPLGRFAHRVVVESHEERPTKIEDNTKHPASLGAPYAFTQASVR